MQDPSRAGGQRFSPYLLSDFGREKGKESELPLLLRLPYSFNLGFDAPQVIENVRPYWRSKLRSEFLSSVGRLDFRLCF